MKKILFLLLLGFYLNGHAQSLAKLDPKACLICEGTVLNYTVTNGEDDYSFTIKITHMSKDKLSFDFALGDNGYGESGSITMDKSTMDNATTLHNYFESGDLALENKTSVWLSRALFSQLMKGKAVPVDLGDGNVENFKLDLNDEGKPSLFSLTIMLARSYNQAEKTKYLEFDEERMNPFQGIYARTFSNEATGHQMMVLDNPDFPLLMYMNIGFEVRLNSIF